MNKLNILWTTVNKGTIEHMITMYATNTIKKGLWKEIDIIIWGASAELVATDKDVQIQLKKMQEAGINIKACKACAENYGVNQELISLGIDVKYMGMPLTEILQHNEKLITI